MWINLDDKEVELVMEALRGNCSDKAGEPTVYDPIHDRFEKTRADFDPADPYRAAAKEQANDELEVDDDAVVSPGDDPGAWVQAWIWIRNDEAGISEDDEDACRDCGEHYADGGDGYNGRCPDCADKAEEEGRSDD
ncbi:hypothetical protein HJB53_30090 [Rhizobium lentis]|uniref:hypothetical protein n=1 Tax=Rhizobium lentis TaxID=1138194 RepID=UPI001C82CAEE|nr:hypothetical protein [Rhizobium lentis]MBX5130742.1 hypothetical protein [Rhizobium lentis]